MKLLTLNLWGGKINGPLLAFIKSRGDSVDVFCFQEVYHNASLKSNRLGEINPNLFADLQTVLPHHDAYFFPTVDDFYGLAIFVKKDWKVGDTGEFEIYHNPDYDGQSGNHSRKAAWVRLGRGNEELLVVNVHGLWTGGGKSDTPERLEQSRVIRRFVDAQTGAKIICGDFNLLPETQSLSLLSAEMQDLIKMNNVTTTRTSFYVRAETSGKFADYIFVSPELRVLDFRVLPEEVSDHAALFAEINLVV